MLKGTRRSIIKINFLFIIFVFASLPFTYAGIISGKTSDQERPITTPRCNVFTFDASASYDPDNEKLSFLWDFGDGETSTEPVIEHTYKKPGDYKATLSITDNSGSECSNATQTRTIRVNMPPVADFEVRGKEFCAEAPLTFDASKSFSPGSSKIYYQWDFGDRTKISGNRRETKTYHKGGEYKVTLTVDYGNNSACSTQKAEKTVKINEPPIADAGENEILRCINDRNDMLISFNASNSKDRDNDKLTYSWDFGDGDKAEGIKVSHQYTDAGEYKAKLIVKDDSNLSCSRSVAFVDVRLDKAPKADAGSDVFGCPDESISFDSTDSFVNKKGAANAKWFFGDGETASGFTATHAYTKPGQYQASLTVENELNNMCPPSRDTRIVSINASPSVSLKSEDSVCLGNKVNFDASSASDTDNDTLEFYWSYGDGVILKEGPKTSHEYKKGGSYKVTVIVDDGKETACSTATADKYVKVNTPPVADAGFDLACCVGMVSKFDASASSDPDNDNLTYTWDFGDGSTVNGVKATHAYSKSGSYNVSLTVDDNSVSSCSKSTSKFTVDVNAKPVPIMNIR